ncbi:hypothetical protein [Mycolicibacterium sp. 120270]|uniref:hypothetical protein n=1 Tax=Mycolicibacterium sp. 120270 TaxID=3090600 RepID=UPI00299DA6C6|nr:hypothetical protein [Mycolicibacterium sp. 120270]MDX1887904.1 hypothetical protein [Mycolicibacterium sp. 120270]
METGTPAAVRRYLDVPEARRLAGLQLAHTLALAAAEGRALDPRVAARELAVAMHADTAAVDLVAATALCAYKALPPPPLAGDPNLVTSRDQVKRRCVA